MLAFNNEKSQELDEIISMNISELLKRQEFITDKNEKYEFLIKERKVIYELLIKINEERRVL